ncbi:hypothetical protein [Solimonas soli]|uniref:hypothetical protein n=1 Tax=Solimonas soli TaxID=413479 RepID=UPI000487E22B|nr:hypothetical protein [Solimonas soli]
MKMRMTAATAVALLAAALSLPAAAADCDLADTLPLKLYATLPSDLFVAQAAPVASASYKLGETISARPGEILLKRKVTMVGQFASFEQDVQYESGMPFSTRYALKAGERYPLLQIPRAPQLYAISLPVKEGNDDWVFISRDGRLCEKPMVFERWHDFLTYRSGSYKATPDVAAKIVSADPDSVADSIDGDTLIVERIDAAAIDLSLRRATGGKMGEAQKGSFAIGSKQIEFGGYRLRVDAAGADGLSVAVIGEPPLD